MGKRSRCAVAVIPANDSWMSWIRAGVVLMLLAVLLSACGGTQEETPVAGEDAPAVGEEAPAAEVEITPDLIEPEITAAPDVEEPELATVEPVEEVTVAPVEEVTVAPVEEVTVAPVEEVTAAPLEATTEVEAGPSEAATYLTEITADPQAFYGQTVTVEGGVNVVKSDTAFTIADNTLLDTGELLVLNANPEALGRALEGEELVRVTGTVRQFVIAEIERETGLDLDTEIEAEFEDKPVLVASSVAMIEGAEDSFVVETEPGLREQFGNITVGEIASNLTDFTGKMVTVREEVEEVIGPNAFSLDEDATFEGGIDNDVLVVSAQESAEIEDGVTARVTGTVQAFDLAAVEQEAGIDLEDTAFADWTGRPVIVARTVEVETEEQEAGATVVPADPEIEQEFGRNITVAEITGNADRFLGRNVTVWEEIEEVRAPGIFTLDEDALLAGGIDNDLLVIQVAQPLLPAMETATAAAATTPDTDATTDPLEGADTEATADPLEGADTMTFVAEPNEGEIAVVSGIVRNVVVAELEREFGLDLNDELVAEFENRPAIIAQSVRIVGGALDDAEDMVAPNPDATATAVEAATTPDATGAGPDALTDMLVVVDAADPTEFVGRPVSFADVTVQSVVGDKTFWVGPNQDQQLFVVLEEDTSAGTVEGQVDVNAGQTVTIIGEIRNLPSLEEARAQWGLSETNSAELEQQQVYVSARRVEITGQ